MIACACTYYLSVLQWQAAHHIIGAPYLIRTHYLQVFSFQENITLILTRQIMVVGKRCSVHYFFKRRAAV